MIKCLLCSRHSDKCSKWMVSFNPQNKVAMLRERDYNRFHLARVDMEAWRGSMTQPMSQGWWWGGLRSSMWDIQGGMASVGAQQSPLPWESCTASPESRLEWKGPSPLARAGLPFPWPLLHRLGLPGPGTPWGPGLRDPTQPKVGEPSSGEAVLGRQRWRR